MVTIRILLCALGCAASSLYAMHNAPSQVRKPWVQAAATIRIESIIGNLLLENFPITDTTTIDQLKNSLNRSRSIPVVWQALYPVKTTPFLWIFSRRHVVGEELADDLLIKDVMHTYDVNALRLALIPNRIGTGD